MKHKFIKREIPEEISEAGGAMIVLVDKNTVELETSIQEALDGLYVIGDKLLIKGFFVGLMKSMIAGVQRDGHARQLGDFLTIYPVVTGEFDLEQGWDSTVNGVKIRVRLMNEMTLDISDWEFEDVTPGRQSFRLESVKAGDTTGVVTIGKALEINGRNLPLTAAIKVEWALEDGTKSGTIPGTKVTSTVSRIDITSDALDELDAETYDGKKIIFTVRGNCANAKISALVQKRQPLATSSDGTLKIMTVKASGNDWKITGSGFAIWQTGQRGIPSVSYTFGDTTVQANDFTVSEDCKTFAPTASEITSMLSQLSGVAACDGTASVVYIDGVSGHPAESLDVPVHFDPA